MSPASKDRLFQDFQEDVFGLFGLPVNNLTLESTKVLLREQASRNNSLVLSTININWFVQSLADPQFRAVILNSDIVVFDGKPLCWLAKCMGCPIQNTVPGSTLIQELNQEKTEKPLSLFLFGGEEGAAVVAMNLVNKNQGGLKAVGALNPGFGSVEEMSTEKIIATITKTEPDILLVALGAKKGCLWIERNRHRLNAKVISHLGATINFLAGTIKRAPSFMRAMGLEWLWRIGQEPKLFTRYTLDGLVMLRLLTSYSVSFFRFLYWQKKYRRKQPNEKFDHQEYSEKVILSFGKNIQLTKNSPIRPVLDACIQSKKNIFLDFQKTEFIDSAFMGLLFLLEKYVKINHQKLTLLNVNSRLKKLFDLFCVQDSGRIFTIDP